jgi:hypothetical protein
VFLSFITDESNSYKIIKIFNADKKELCSYCSEDIIPDEIWLMFMRLMGCHFGITTLTDVEMNKIREDNLL